MNVFVTRIATQFFSGGGLPTALATLCTLTCTAGETPESGAMDDAIAELTRPQSTIEIGAGGLSDSSFTAGNYTGLVRRGAFVIGAFDLRGEQYSFGHPGDDKTRWRVTGANLGLDSRSIAGEYGRQGDYRITFGVDQIPRLNTDRYHTPFLGAGTGLLMLPAGFVRGTDTGAMSALAASLQRVDIESTRRRADIGVNYSLSREWELRAGFRNDERHGAKLRGAEFGSNGGNARSALLTEPIDSSTQSIDLGLAFAGDDLRFTLGYHGSLFRNHFDSLIWQNPYSNAPWVGGPSGLPVDFPLPAGQAGLAPDNQFHQLSVSAALDFSSSTRLTLSGTQGRMTQNEPFLPYTVNAGLASIALPRHSLNGLIETTFLNARLSMRPMRTLSVNMTLRYEDRDNQTPLSEYVYVGGDVQLQPPASSNSDRIRTNLPRSRRHEQIVLEADYRIAPGSALKAGWELDGVARTFAEVERARESTYRLELRHGSGGPWSINASVAQLARRGSPYRYHLPYLASYTSAAYINAMAAANGCIDYVDCIRNGPLPSKFYLADRDRQRARFMFGYAPDAAISLQARLDANRDRYPRSGYGVTEAGSWSAGADLGLMFNENVSATLFHAFDAQRSVERSRQILSANTAVASSEQSDWINRFADRTTTLGAGLRMRGLLGGKLELDLDAIAVRGRTPVSTSVGPAVSPAQNPATPFPDLSVRSDDIRFNARYALDRVTAIRLNYFYRRLNSADWATEQVGAPTLANVIGTLETPARFSLHGAGISYVRRFR